MAGLDPFTTPSKPDLNVSAKKSQVPTSRSFTASVSGFWKPTRDPFLQWLKNLPGPVEEEKQEPVEPARYHTLKHSLAHDSSDDEECHRSKRVKIGSDYETVESRRRRLAKNGRGFVRRVSSACKQAVVSSRPQSVFERRPDSRARRCVTPAPEPTPTPSPGTPSFMLIERPKMRFVLVGDAQCGKSSMILRFYRDTFHMHYSPTRYELYHKVVRVDDQDIDIELWDTAGDASLEQLARLNYLAWDAVFLCFSVGDPKSLESARSEWITRIRRYTRGAPIILVGTKTDQRVGPSLWAPLYPSLAARVTATEGSMTAISLGATRYVECSAMTGQGSDGVFEEGVRAVSDGRASVSVLDKRSSGHLSGLAELLCFK
ncbi:P-loop containing nucleoside triphosphate hydrolase protein [Poronia punctata]|nr:P-loop containing nucleoside triphosphate hydrolase protein [Poronia punctata]